MAAHPPDALPTNADADLPGIGKKRKSDTPDRQSTPSPSVKKLMPSLLSTAEKKLLQGKAAKSPTAPHKQAVADAEPQSEAGLSPKRAPPSMPLPSARKPSASKDRRKSHKGEKQGKDSPHSTQLQPTVSSAEESGNADDAGGGGTITPVKPDNRKTVRAAKAKTKAAATAAAAAVQSASGDDATPDGANKPKGKRAQPKDTKPQQARNPPHASVISPRTHASVIQLLILTLTQYNIRQSHTSNKMNECNDLMYMRPDYLSGGSRIISHDLPTALLRVGGEVARTGAHHSVRDM